MIILLEQKRNIKYFRKEVPYHAEVDPPLHALCAFRIRHHWLCYDTAVVSRTHLEAESFTARQDWVRSPSSVVAYLS